MAYHPRPTNILAAAFQRSASVRSTDDTPNAGEIVAVTKEEPYHLDFVFSLDNAAVFGSPFELYMMRKDDAVAYQLKTVLAGSTSFGADPYPHFNLIATDEQDIMKKLAEIKADGVDKMEMRTWEEIQNGFLLPKPYRDDIERRINKGEITLVKLPEIRHIVNAAQANDGDYLICSINYSNPLYEFRLFKGQPDDLKEQEILSHSSYGFTHTGSTPAGKFYIPDPENPIDVGCGIKPKWNGAEIKPVDLDTIKALIGDRAPRAQGVRKFKAGM